ncbi:MAG: PAS domain-containing protein [Pyrinomonadaceae bacterium]|nr:PAS domain-containing protein [Pyrinomonadaceae bacterium]
MLLGELAQCRRSEAGYRGLMGSNVLGIMFAREDGTITNANDTFLRMLGYAREELNKGELCWHHISPLEESLNEYRRDDTSGPVELQFVRKNGQRVKLLFAAEYVTGGQKIIGFAHSLAP